MSKTVFLDMGGTLVESPDFFETVSGRLVGGAPDGKTLKLVAHTFMQIFLDRDPHKPFQSVEKILEKTLSLLAAESGYRDISAEAHELLFEVYLHRSRLFPEVIEVLEALQKEKVKMVIASDADTGLINEEMRKFKLKPYFDDKCVSDAVEAYKPGEKFIRYLKKYSAGNENSCFFVGDSQVDIESGQALGITSILIDRKKSGKDGGADFVIGDLTELLPVLGIARI